MTIYCFQIARENGIARLYSMSVSASFWVIALINTFILYPKRVIDTNVTYTEEQEKEEEEEEEEEQQQQQQDITNDITLCAIDEALASSEQRKNISNVYTSSDIKYTSEELVNKSFLDKVKKCSFNAETNDLNNTISKVNQTKFDVDEFQQSADNAQLCKSKSHPRQKRNGLARDSSSSYRIKSFRNYMCSALYLVFCYWFTILNLRLQGYIGSFNAWIDTVSEHDIMKGLYICVLL